MCILPSVLVFFATDDRPTSPETANWQWQYIVYCMAQYTLHNAVIVLWSSLNSRLTQLFTHATFASSLHLTLTKRLCHGKTEMLRASCQYGTVL